MFHSHQRKEGLSIAIFGLWCNWTIAVGFIAILTFMSPMIRQVWLAPVCVVAYIALQVVRKVMSRQAVPVCSRLYQEVSGMLLVVTLVVALRTIFTGGGEAFELTGQPVNPQGPLLGVLISAPVGAIVAAIYLMQKSRPLVCQLCEFRYGNIIENGFIGRLYQREWRYQTKLLMINIIIIGAVAWAYYLLEYVNVNLNRSDYFFFVWMPMIAYVASLIFLGWRYYSLWIYYCQNDETNLVNDPSSTTVRFIVMCDDRMLIDIRQTSSNFNNGQIIKRFDTPAVVSLPYQERCDEGYAARLFKQISGIGDAEIRMIYESPDSITFRNIFHFFAFVDSTEQVADSKLHGEWMNLGELRQLIAMKLISADLNSELNRIYRIAMAWKTYDREGHRLYKIRHYRPTFRLKDLRSWDVDYNDGHWLSVGHHNEDSRFFKLRKFLRRLDRRIRGISLMLN